VEPTPLPRKPNYDFEKRRKELDRKARKDAKREDRQRRRDEESAKDEGGSPTAAGEGDAEQPGTPAPVV
jgi:hypothetical protein